MEVRFASEKARFSASSALKRLNVGRSGGLARRGAAPELESDARDANLFPGCPSSLTLIRRLSGTQDDEGGVGGCYG